MRKGIIDAVRRRRRAGRALIIVLDGLDEAADTDARKRIARDLIRRLGNEAQRLGITVIVSCRSGIPASENEELIRLLGGSCVRVQADSEEYVSLEDFIAFAEARLLDHEDKMPIWRDEDRVVEIAEKVANAAYPVYLVAQLVTRSLIDDPNLTERELENRTFPRTVGEAFEEYLARFGDDEQKLRDLLAGLSHARGAGFTLGATWLEVVTCVSGRTYNEEDLNWLLRSGAAFLIETVATDEAPRYRLYHQALVDMLQEPEDAPAVYRLMLGRVAASADDGYLRTHLSGHAVAAGMISEFLLDPTAVTACDITVALRDAARAGRGISAAADKARLALSSVAFELETRPDSERRAYLSLAGHQYDVPSFRGRAEHSWWNAWYADWDVASEHMLVERGRPYTEVTVVKSGNDDLIVAADADGVVNFRWADDRAEAFSQLSLGAVITCLTASAAGDQFVVGVGTDIGDVYVWDSRHQTARRITQLDGSVTSISIRQRHQTRFEVLATSSDGSVEKQERSLTRRISRATGHIGIAAMSCCFVSARDTFIAVGTAGSGIKMLRHEDLSADSALGAPDAGYVDALYPARFAADQELSVVAAGTAAFGVWGLEFGFLREQFLDSSWSGRGSTLLPRK
ncbi:hypothetical protein [Nocardioides sp. TF02-7]|uniref:hypothetical protein n=1 Tax=Nocardioides sp. TF02-7 TaxID=2917724 RepID=UPI001F0642F1|nr:hypothetical protein [Nocardioides sp. TF02-7]UMG93568.1 hypothetical protein MF408_05085 [Nocardioides sp. TF02-7]